MAKKFYKSHLAGLEIVVGEADRDAGEVAPKTVRFEPFREKVFGDPIKVGYLATDNEIAQAAIESDPNVVEIKKEDYDKATGEGSQPIGY